MLLGGRRWLVLFGAAAALLVLVAIEKWRAVINRGGQSPVEPFRIAGNLYYVGASEATAFLLTGPEGHVLIDGGYPGTAPMILESITALGFDIADVKVLLNSHAHFDHAGGLAALQEESGAELWVSEADADIVAAGGVGDPTVWAPHGFLALLGLLRYPAPRVDHRFEDGARIRLGPLELTAHVTAGHTPGCTSWSFHVRDGARELLVVSVGSLTLLPYVSLVEPETYPGIRADFEASFAALRDLPADVFLASHASWFGLKRKLFERVHSDDPVDPFVDREGYLAFIEGAERRFREVLAEQGAQRRRKR